MNKLIAVLFVLVLCAMVLTACSAPELTSAALDENGKLVLTYSDGTKQTVESFKTIVDASIDEDMNLIVTYSDGTKETIDSLKIIVSAELDKDMHLIITYSDGTTEDKGYKGPALCTVTFVDYDDTVLATKTTYAGLGVEVPEDPTREGYVFKGWDTDLTKITESVTVKATYEAKSSPTSYSVTVSGTGEEGTVFGGGSYAYGDQATVVATAHTGYAFLGWYENGSKVSSSESYTFTVREEKTLTAKWMMNGDHPIFADFEVSINTSNGSITITGAKSNKASYVIPEGVTSIGWCAFEDCTSLTSITIPDSVTSIDSFAFQGCTGLTSITIPDSVTSIGGDAFDGCPKLIEVYNRSSLSMIKGSTDCGCIAYCAKNIYTPNSGSSKLSVKDDFIFYNDNGSYYLMGYQGNKTDITLPADINGKGYAIYQYAFSCCAGLTSVTIPSGVTSIGNYAFEDCTSLISVTIGKGITSIGSYAFDGCRKLIEVCNLSSLSITAGSYSYGDVAYYAKNVYKPSSGSSKLTVKDNFVFYNDNGRYCLVGYKGNETDITLPSDIDGKGYAIYQRAFKECTSLTSISIPDSVTSIGSYAFEECTSLTSVIIPLSVTSIDGYAFCDCTALESVKYCGTESEWSDISKDFNWDKKTGNYIITYNYTGS